MIAYHLQNALFVELVNPHFAVPNDFQQICLFSLNLILAFIGFEASTTGVFDDGANVERKVIHHDKLNGFDGVSGVVGRGNYCVSIVGFQRVTFPVSKLKSEAWQILATCACCRATASLSLFFL